MYYFVRSLCLAIRPAAPCIKEQIVGSMERKLNP